MAFKAVNCGMCAQRQQETGNEEVTSQLWYYAFIMPLKIVMILLFSIIFGALGSIIGVLAAVILTVPTWIFIFIFLARMAATNCIVK